MDLQFTFYWERNITFVTFKFFWFDVNPLFVVPQMYPLSKTISTNITFVTFLLFMNSSDMNFQTAFTWICMVVIYRSRESIVYVLVRRRFYWMKYHNYHIYKVSISDAHYQCDGSKYIWMGNIYHMYHTRTISCWHVLAFCAVPVGWLRATRRLQKVKKFLL